MSLNRLLANVRIENETVLVPIWNENASIFVFNVMPIPYDDGHHRWRYMYNRGHSQLIAVSRDGRYYSDDVSQCHTDAPCLFEGLMFNMRSMPSCTSAMYVGDAKSVKKNCKANLRSSTATPVIYQRGRDVYIFSPIRIVLRHVCPENDTAYAVTPYKRTHLVLRDGCRLWNTGVIMSVPRRKRVAIATPLLPSLQPRPTSDERAYGILSTVAAIISLAAFGASALTFLSELKRATKKYPPLITSHHVSGARELEMYRMQAHALQPLVVSPEEDMLERNDGRAGENARANRIRYVRAEGELASDYPQSGKDKESAHQ